MPFTKTTTRALAASVAFVAAGATLAGAAVFQVPILGFGRASVASATAGAGPARPAVVVARRKVTPKVIIKTRYVDDIVHRRAPVRGYNVQAAPAPAPAPAPAAVAPSTIAFAAPAPTVAAPTTIAPRASTTTSPTTAASIGDSPDAHESDNSPPPTGHSPVTVPAQTPAVDQ